MQSFKRIDFNNVDIFNVPLVNRLLKSHEIAMNAIFTEKMDIFTGISQLQEEEKVPLDLFNPILRGGFPCMCRTCELWSLSPADRQNKGELCTCGAHVTNESFCKYCGNYGYIQHTEGRLVINIPLPLFITKYFTSVNSSFYMETLLGYILWYTGSEDMSKYGKYPHEKTSDFNPLNIRDDSIPVVDAPNALHYSEGENAHLLLAYGANPNLYTKTWYKSKICTTYADEKWKIAEEEVACALDENREPLIRPGTLRYKIQTPLFFSDMHRILFSKVHEMYVDADGNKLSSNFENKSLPMTLALLQAGGDPNATDNEGKTPIFFSNLVKTILLIQYGADINHKDSKGRNASSFADKYKKQYMDDILSGKYNRFVNPVIASYRVPALHQFDANGKKITSEQAAVIHKYVPRNEPSRRGWGDGDSGRGGSRGGGRGGRGGGGWGSRGSGSGGQQGGWRGQQQPYQQQQQGGRRGGYSSNRW